MQITVSVQGQMVRKGLQDLQAETPKIGRQGVRTLMERIKRRMQAYPAEPAGQSVSSTHATLGTIYRTAKGRYHRTGNLGSHWSITEVSNGYTLENTAQRRGRKYGKFVVGNAYGQEQAWMHKGRWQVLRDVVDEEVEKEKPEIKAKILMVARRSGL